MKQISLSQGKFALVDDSDYKWLNQWKWSLLRRRHQHKYYAVRGDKNNKIIYMHREILGLKRGREVQADHINNNGIDNRRVNLRKCTHKENQRNQPKNVTNTSGYKGVTWYKAGGKWHAQIKVNRTKYHLGYFFCLIKAAKAYDRAARKYHGDFANLNFK